MDILLVEDKASLRKALAETLKDEGYTVDAVGREKDALERLETRRYRVVLSDIRLPGGSGMNVLDAALALDTRPAVILMTAYATVKQAVEAVKKGALDFMEKPVDMDLLLHLVKRAMKEQSLMHENILLREEFSKSFDFPRIVGESGVMKEVGSAVQRAATTSATVLLQGESGTGKELFARAIHRMSPRAEHPFVAINCAAIPEKLLENELFGHEKGAYTGAHEAQMGKFELAHRGTLFLDEISELHYDLQAKVLRIIEEKCFERIGGRRVIEVDVRIVVATNRNLEVRVKEKKFRDDLFFRLNVFPVTIPPLRERGDDLLILAEEFLKKYAKEMGKKGLSFSDASRDVMRRYAWPGNVRELQNAVERAVIMAEDNSIEPEQLMLPSG